MTRNQAEAAAREESVNSSRQPRAQPWLVGSADTHKESEAERGRERQREAERDRGGRAVAGSRQPVLKS